jgi:hypothetical protein
VKARNALRTIYHGIEQALDLTLKEANHYYFLNLQDKKDIDLTLFLTSYIDFVNRSILAKELSVSVHAVPSFEGIQLFEFMPSTKGLKNYENKLNALVSFIENQLHDLKRSQDDVWPLVSIAVMGQEPLSGALAYGLSHPPTDGSVWSGENLTFYSAPVSIFSRISEQHLSFGDLHLEPGDLVVFSPIICHRRSLQANEASNRSLSFGHGAHSCPGRKMIIKIIDAFFRDLNQYNLDFNLEGMALKRDINLLPTQIKNKNVVTGE